MRPFSFITAGLVRGASVAILLGLSAVTALSARVQASPRTGILLVANQQSASATLIDLATGSSTEIPVGAGPHEAAISPDGRWGVVTVYGTGPAPGNQLAIIDIARRAVARMVDLGEYRRPHDVVFLPGSSTRVAVTSEASQRIVIADIARGSVEATVETQAPGSHMLALAADGATLFTANVPAGGVSQLDLAGRRFVRQIAVAPATEGIAITPDGREVWVGSNTAGTVTVITAATGRIATTIPDLGMPYRITISPDGRWALVPDPTGNRVHVIDVARRRPLGEIRGIGSPRGVEIGADNRTAFITLGPEGEVVVADLVERTVLARHKVGAAPDGVGWGIRTGR
jgi:YVTN family beta-propeller protein